jgi:hypothetical protein
VTAIIGRYYDTNSIVMATELGLNRKYFFETGR